MSELKKVNEEKKPILYIWDSYVAKCVQIYFVVFMTVFLLYCKEGYFEYDLYKRNLFYGISLIFIFSTVLMLLLSLSSNERRPWKELFSKMDLWIVGIFGTWAIGWFFSESRSDAFWGDRFRYIGISYLVLGIIGMWIISRYIQWNIWMTRLFVVICTVIFIWQNLNCYYIDPLNWTMDQTYHGLMACLANINQNACFNVLVLSVGMVMFFHAKERKDKIVLGIFLLLGYMGGIAVSSATYFSGIGLVFVVLVAYVLRHSEYLWDLWMEVLLFWLAAIIQKIGITLYQEEQILLDSVGQFMLNGAVLLILAVVLILAALLLWKADKFLKEKERMLSNIYLGLVGIVVLFMIGCLIYANTSGITAEDGGFLSKFVISDMSGNARGLIWRVTIGSFAQESWIHKLFGCGLNNFKDVVYKYYALDLIAVWGTNTILADAHNVYLDILLSSGIVGFICYFGLPIHVMVKCIRYAKKNPIALYGILGVVGWFAVGLTNANLNMAVQVFYVMLGVYWGLLRRLDRGETIDSSIKVI